MSVAAFVPRASGAQRAGLMVVLGLHVLIGAALLHGLARTVIERSKPPIVDVTPLKPAEPPKPEPTSQLPPPDTVPLPTPFAPVPEVPLPEQPPLAAAITTTREPVPSAGPAAGDAAGTTALPGPGTPVAARPVARPAIGNVQACAPTGDDYPVAARRAEAAGMTRLRFTVSAGGALVRSEVVRSAGPSREHKLLDRVAESKLAGCSFSAGIDENGQAIGGTFEVDYVWKLDGL